MKFNQDQSTWDTGKMDHLRRLWENGMSAAEIARILKTSRNAIIGKAHRMGLTARPNPIKFQPNTPIENPTKEQEFRQRRAKQQRELTAKKRAAAAGAVPSAPAEKPKPAPQVKRPRIVLPEPAGPLTLEETQERNGCRWPSGHRPNMTFCGKDRHTDDDPTAPYCYDHTMRSINHNALSKLRAA